MTDKNVQIKNVDGDLLYPKTKGSLVLNNSNENLGSVEAGAQVNIIEGVQVNSTDLTPDANRKVNVSVPAYSIEKQTVAETGYAATYYLTKDGVLQGTKINIAKDQVLDNVEQKTCDTADVPVQGYVVGDIYWEFTFQNTSKKLYIKLSDFVDVYTAGNGLSLNNKVFAIDTTIVCTVSTFNSHANDTDIHVTTSDKSTWNGKQDAITSSNKLDADLVDDTSSTNKFVTSSDITNWNGKADAATTLSGYGITDGLTYSIITSV